ncbi:MAG TPA: O-antigen polymerase [Croceibacterium sp.]|nr:O-antigen polymerase [Croceibacterium sp.]
MFHGLVFVIRPLFAWDYGFDSIYKAMGFMPSEWEKTQVLICTNLGLVVFVAVTMALTPNPLRFQQDEFDKAQRALLLERFWLVAAPLVLVALYTLYWVWGVKAAGQSVGEVDANTGVRTLQGVNGYFISAGAMLVPIVAAIAFLGRFRPWSLAPFVAFSVVRLGTGSRGDFVAAAVTIAILFLFDRRKKWPNLPVVVAAGVLAVVFNSIQQDRGAAIRESFGYENAADVRSLSTEDARPLESQDIANLEFFEYLVWAVPKRTGSYDYFLHNLQIFTEPIPRALWKDKPVGAPIKMFELYRYGRTIGATSSMPGAGWYSWGYAGVAIWSAVFALIYGGAYRAVANSRQSNVAMITYAIFLATAVVAFRDGALITIMKQLLFYLVPPAALWFIARATNVPSAARLREWATAAANAAPALAAITPRERRAAVAGQLAPNAAMAEAAAAPTPHERRLARMRSLALPRRRRG